ncbi:protein of unknown function DUF1320 [Leptothrix cholodnii SP-6]|uniref:DUF1320 domain-containing protein n=1 Tax=Leptothrix cholodnii (strain ATCC 51168 / LMG 8142 / SP-6) TaxID=395495 RepID=B1Y3H9_LEPCP|nr:DUF1320 domain-containing protein [Leptothrix cholodnii]ACB34507.1 protein of unknown function DUF1320 [Leptothrix cholodnii SP-6]
MPYATQQDMIDRFGSPRLQQLTDIEEPLLGAIRPAVIAAKLADADAEIDGYLIGRYELPLAAWPAILKVHACSICWYRLLGSSADEPARRDYEDALAYLVKVARGDVVVVAPSAAPPVSGAGAVLFDAGSKVFGRES